MSIVCGVPQEKQPPFLGAEEENQTHHHRERRVVQTARGNIFEELPSPIHIGAIQCLDEHLHCPANLVPELIGDLLLVRNRLLEHLLERIGVGHGEEPTCTEKRPERSKCKGFLEPKERVTGGVTRRLPSRCIDEHPPVTICDEPEANTRDSAEVSHTLRRRGGPGRSVDAAFQVLPEGPYGAEEPGLTSSGTVAWIDNDEVGMKDLSVLRDFRTDLFRNAPIR